MAEAIFAFGGNRQPMVGVDDLDEYREQNDIRPEDPAPREPQGDPDYQTDDFWIWQFDAEASEQVNDTYLVAKDPAPLDFRMWVFAGKGSKIHFIMRASHKYGQGEPHREDCCEVLMDGQSLQPKHCPPEAEELVAELTGADVVLPRTSDTSTGGPVSY